jgi:hypothetical protein
MNQRCHITGANFGGLSFPGVPAARGGAWGAANRTVEPDSERTQNQDRAAGERLGDVILSVPSGLVRNYSAPPRGRNVSINIRPPDALILAGGFFDGGLTLANEGGGPGIIYDTATSSSLAILLRTLAPDASNPGISIATVGGEVLVGSTITGMNLSSASLNGGMVGPNSGTVGLFVSKTAGGLLQFLGLTPGANVLMTPSPVDVTVAVAPAGLSGQIQYNTSGVLDASSNLTWDNAANTLSVSGAAPSMIVGGTAVDTGAVLQLKSNTGAAPVLLSPGTTPSALVAQAQAVIAAAGVMTAQTLRLTNHSSLYADVTLQGSCTAGSLLGQVSTFHLRFTAKRYDETTGTSLSAITIDFADDQLGVISAPVITSGTDVYVQVPGKSGHTIVWNVDNRLSVSAGW